MNRIVGFPSPRISRSFRYTGAGQTFVIPTGVDELFITLAGAGGGQGTLDSGAQIALGGNGIIIAGPLFVVAGVTLNIFIGGTGGSFGAAGFNGGAAGSNNVNDDYGGGGGGRTDLRYGTTSGEMFVAVAGGGGGGGSRTGLTGGNGCVGLSYTEGAASGAGAGNSGTVRGGGNCGTAAFPGKAYDGGAGAVGTGNQRCGGGGGGLFGGGGGNNDAGACGGGGGGSSLLPEGWSVLGFNSRATNGWVTIEYAEVPL